MKITASILIVVFLSICAQGYGQGITLFKKNASLEFIFDEIQKQAGYNFFYQDEWLKHAKKINIDVHDATINNVLDLCFLNQPFSYKITGRTIVLSNRSKHRDPLQTSNDQSLTDVSGRIRNEKGELLDGITVIAENGAKATSTNSFGEFSLNGISANSTLVITGTSIEHLEMKPNGRKVLDITVNTKISTIEEVIVSTGYQDIPKERATGSFVKINNELYNRKMGPQVLDRLDGVSNGVLFDKRKPTANIQIRGLFTLTESISQPLIVVDNFPYEGNINNLNPNDVESVTILKDASATSIWGARAGNGVIVITTKKGSFNKPLSVSVNSSITVFKEIDLFKIPDVSVSDYIDFEKNLFDKGYYDEDITNSKEPVTPAVQIFAKQRNGLLTFDQASAELDELRQKDVRNDFEKYWYRKQIIRQNTFNLSGGTKKVKYFFSGGLDHDRQGQVGNDNTRLTLRSDNTFLPFKNFQIRIGAAYTHTSTNFSNAAEYESLTLGTKKLPLYMSLVDDQGNPAVVDYKFKGSYTDTIGSGKLLDWKYRPLQELGAKDNNTKTNAFIADLDLKYNFTSDLSAEIKYQYQYAKDQTVLNRTTQTYYTRDIINDFTEINDGVVKYNVPNGNIRDESGNNLSHNALRAQLNYNKIWNKKHSIYIIGGAEVREINNSLNGARSYAGPVDYAANYKVFSSGSFSHIPTFSIDPNENTSRFVSIYGNASYSFMNRYILTASARKDASNLFGVTTNQRGVPLWSMGADWKISNEKFYNSGFLPGLNLRVTYGYSGNVNNTISALATIKKGQQSGGIYMNYPSTSVVNIPNAQLRWEKVRQINLGLDLNSKNNRIKGSIEFFSKKSTDVLGAKQLDPTVGRSSLLTNAANVQGNGFDLQLNTLNIDAGSFKWGSIIIFNEVTYNVTRYFFDSRTGYVSAGGDITPIEGYNPYLVVSYKWAGLDPLTGDPQGYLNKNVSKNYDQITSNTPFSDQYISGPALPKYFGNLTNQFTWKGFTCSVNVVYKFGYFFRRPTISYDQLTPTVKIHPDYLKRWKQPGDEKITNVPSVTLPSGEATRYSFFENSEITAEKGDHIRLDDIRLSYSFNRSLWKKLPFKELQLYMYIGDMNVLVWKKNKQGIDPDYPLGIRPSTSIATGLKIDL